MRQKLYSAFIWTVLSFGVTKSLQFISNLVLTRLLFPEAFGIMALVNVVLLGITLLSDVGLRTSVIQSDRGDSQEFLKTVWTVKAIRGAVLSLIACLLAWPISIVYQEPLLFPLICFCSLKSLFDGIQSVLLLKVQRDMDLKRFVFLQIGVQAVSFLVTISLAFSYKTVWALAIGSVVGGFAHLVLSHVFFQYGHKFFIDRGVFKELVIFGRWIFLATAVTFMGGQGLKGLEGYLLGTEVFGFLFISSMLAAFIEQGYKSVAGQVLFPYLSSIHRDSGSLFGTKFYRARIFCLAPAVIGLIMISFFASDIVNFLYDERYSPSGPFLAIISINCAIGLLPNLYSDAVLAQGNSKLYSAYLCIYSVVIVAGALLGFMAFGVIGMLVGQGVGALLGYGLALAITWRYSIATILFDIGCLLAISLGAYLTYLIHFV